MITDDTELSQDVVFDILSSPRRRYVLYHLRQEGGPVELTELAKHVAAWENETSIEDLSSQDRKRVYVSLYQTHIPRLAEVGIVDYDEDTGEVSLAGPARQIDPYITGKDRDLPWNLYYFMVALASALLLVGSVTGVPFLAALNSATLALGIILAFVALAAVQTIYRWRARNDVPDALERHH